MPVENLFNIIYSGYSTPLEAQQLKAQVQIKQNEAQAGLIELANQKATQGALQQIWQSPLGAAAATGTDADKDKLNMTAALLMKKGDVQGATRVLSSVATIEERQAQTRKDQMVVETQRRQDISQTAGAITDQSTYSAAFPAIMEKLGPDAQKLGLTGIYSQDQKKLDFLSKAGASWAQKASVAERDRALDINQFYKGLGAQMAEARLNEAQQRLELANRAADRADASLAERKQEDARRDERMSHGLRQDPGKQYAQNLKVTPTDSRDAVATFGIDPRTMNMDPKLQQQYATLAAGRAKEMMANELRKDPESDVNYDTSLGQVMDQMEKEGLFKPTHTSGVFGIGGSDAYSYKAPSWAKAGQGAPPKGQASKAAVSANEFPTADSVAKAYKNHTLTYDQAQEILKKKGWAQ